MIRRWRFVALGVAACTAAALWPITPAVSPADVLQVRLSVAVMAIAACAILGTSKSLRSAHVLVLSVGSALASVAALWAYFNASVGCLADYDGRPLVIGRELTDGAVTYVQDNPGLSSSDLLLDAGGDPARMWTVQSIRTCRFLVSWGGLASIPLATICVGALLARGRRPFIEPARPAATPAPASPGVPVYDAFLSYRHTEPDRSRTLEILAALEARGMRVAIDVRDFAPNEHFLSEMERCIRQSRFVLCIVTSQYLASDHTSEEAIISKTLDMAERRKRLVPLILERVELPVWLHGLVGIDFTSDATVDPLERLLALLGQKPVGART
jgi:TIR domain